MLITNRVAILYSTNNRVSKKIAVRSKSRSVTKSGSLRMTTHQKMANFNLKIETPWNQPHEIPVVHTPTITVPLDSERGTGMELFGGVWILNFRRQWFWINQNILMGASIYVSELQLVNSKPKHMCTLLLVHSMGWWWVVILGDPLH